MVVLTTCKCWCMVCVYVCMYECSWCPSPFALSPLKCVLTVSCEWPRTLYKVVQLYLCFIFLYIPYFFICHIISTSDYQPALSLVSSTANFSERLCTFTYSFQESCSLYPRCTPYFSVEHTVSPQSVVSNTSSGCSVEYTILNLMRCRGYQSAATALRDSQRGNTVVVGDTVMLSEYRDWLHTYSLVSMSLQHAWYICLLTMHMSVLMLQLVYSRQNGSACALTSKLTCMWPLPQVLVNSPSPVSPLEQTMTTSMWPTCKWVMLLYIWQLLHDIVM